MRNALPILLLFAAAASTTADQRSTAADFAATYVIRLEGKEVGEERVELRTVAGRRVLESRASIDSDPDVRTHATYELADHGVTRMRMTRRAGDATADLTIEAKGDVARVTAAGPRSGAIDISLPHAPGDLLGGAMHAHGVVSDLVANWVLAAERIAAGARTIDFDLIELRSGEPLPRATAGEMKWTVKPHVERWEIEMQGRAGVATRKAQLFLDAARRPVKIEVGDDLVIERKGDPFAAFIDGVMQREMERERVPGAAFVFVKDGRIVHVKGYGENVDPAKTIWRVGSISKTFTATAIMRLAERGDLHLHADAQRYLTGVTIPTNYPLPVTVADLLMHTAGFDEIRPGTQVSTAAEVQSLPDFLRTRLVRIRPPGKVTAYSTYGMTVAGAIVEEVTKKPFEEAMRELVWQPLEMERTNITVPESLRGDVALGYERDGETLVPQPWEWYHTTPASSINSTVADMAKYMMFHLANLGEQHRQHVTMHPLIPGVTYGFFEDFLGDLRVIEHGGNMAGYSAQMTLIPSDGAGFFVVNHFEGSQLRNTVRAALLEYLYPAARARHRPPPPPIGFAARAAQFTGRYTWMVGCKSCTPRGVSLILEVKSDGDVLVIQNQRWIEVDPLVFQHEGGGGRLVFRADDAGNIVEMHSGGFWSFEKL